ncbi:carboxypeptidase-like regulatory domain-containing protein [Acidipila sp. EB88]|uniref:carboxypeptidase-like regulatory domain-containing protein n=1 Tax=Acidipila sp. EB88 TaxID=2305226 RepID=UPI000F5FEFA2|nr:carboxypeptidase-like regulatory domain-containing protein [Acidipila sp. EB88]RRA48715.1 carboxypeptidase regulatory-like domain-containing protein [Acidipila sp. EB88]
MTTIRSRNLLLLLFLFGAGVLSGTAQSTLGSVSGRVEDTTRAALPAATIRLHRIETNSDRTLLSAADGSFNALNVDPGTYDIAVSLAGFATDIERGVVVDARQQLRLDLTLRPGP